MLACQLPHTFLNAIGHNNKFANFHNFSQQIYFFQVVRNDHPCMSNTQNIKISDPAGGAYDAPPDPLIVGGFAPPALAFLALRARLSTSNCIFPTNGILSPQTSTLTCAPVYMYH